MKPLKYQTHISRNFFWICSLTAALAVNASAIAKQEFSFVVGVDGDFKAAMAAASAAGPTESKRFLIFFPDGEYDIGSLTGDENQRTVFQSSNVSFIGQSTDKTVIFNRSINEGISITATLYFPKNNNIYMQDMTVLNKANYGNENNCGSACRHVAIQQIGDKFIYKNVKLLSTQDTYYTKKSGSARTYWEGGQIEGTVDFICGDGDVFFEGTNLVMRRKDGYLTAAQTKSDWGYVFNNAKINVSNGSFNGMFYLGRSWGTAKTVFLNTTMYAQPTAVGWATNMNSAPVVFGEYNSKDGNGNAVNTSQRRTFFDGSKDGSTATLKTVWDASDAAKYTLENVLGGTDSWKPNQLTKQVNAPKISQAGAIIEWDDDESALCWVVFVNGKYHSNTTANSIDVGKIAEGSKLYVRAANSMGGLGEASNEITVTEASAVYHKVSILSSIGGTVTVSPNRETIAEGTQVTFKAEPAEGWHFNGWTGKNAADAGALGEWSTMLESDIEIGATFDAKGTTTFQAETGIVENAIIESTNAGFAGTGYINFGTGVSYVKIPVYAEKSGIYTLTMTFTNGSKSPRDLAITAKDSTKNTIVTFDATEGWTTYETKDTSIALSSGISYITFAVVDGNDGPNLDQIKITPDILDSDPATSDTSADSVATDTTATDTITPGQSKPDTTTRIRNIQLRTIENPHRTQWRLYSTAGKLIRESSGPMNLQGLNSGIYMLQKTSPSGRQSKLIEVH